MIKLTTEEKQTMIMFIGAILSIPFAILLHYHPVSPGIAFILGIAYAGIWKGD